MSLFWCTILSRKILLDIAMKFANSTFRFVRWQDVLVSSFERTPRSMCSQVSNDVTCDVLSSKQCWTLNLQTWLQRVITVNIIFVREQTWIVKRCTRSYSYYQQTAFVKYCLPLAIYIQCPFKMHFTLPIVCYRTNVCTEIHVAFARYFTR